MIFVTQPFRKLLRVVGLLGGLLSSHFPHAQEVRVGEVLPVATRDGVVVPIYASWRNDARATVVLFPGGAGGYGQIADDGWPTGGNFLIRTGKHWASHPFNVVMVGRAADDIDLSDGTVRIGEKHAADNVAIFKAIKDRSPLPIWVVGTSMGTISVAAAAIRDNENLIAGAVLTSSILAYKISGALPRQDLERIRVPTLVFHHENDACWACRPYEAGSLIDMLKNAPIRKLVLVRGGAGALGDPCEPMHHHGYVGMEDEAVDLIAAWITEPVD